MKKYFYSNGQEKYGPFSLEELKNEEIKRDMLIWFEGLENWTPACDLKEMIPILELKPPPISTFDKEPEVEKTDEKPQEKESAEYLSNSTLKHKQGMFSSPFSFEGRIRRFEYGLSVIISTIASRLSGFIIQEMIKAGTIEASLGLNLLYLSFIPLLWFLWAQGAKRCHDMGNSGWYQLIPFYGFWMIFASGESGINKYGLNPKS